MLCHSAECHSSKCYYAECHSAECHSSKCYYAECHSAECHSATPFDDSSIKVFKISTIQQNIKFNRFYCYQTLSELYG